MEESFGMMAAEPRRFRCIAFDAVGTLIYPMPAAGEVYHQVARRFGSRLPADEVIHRFRRAFRESERGDLALPDGTRLATSEEREYQRWKEIVTSVLDDVSNQDGCFAELFAHFANPSAWRCFDEVPPLLAELRARGYQVLIASNFDRRLHSVCDGLPALKDFPLRIISSEVGCRKPGQGFFDALVARASCPRDEILMIGDDPANDVTGARQAGLSALLVNRRTQPTPGELADLSALFSVLEP
jgi:putative hydrolase of the HAD superfamily